MRKSRVTVEQLLQALRQAEGGTPVVEICRKLTVTETTFYRWKKQYTGLNVSELKELRQLREKNRRLTQVVADMTLDPFDPPRRPRQTMVSPAQRRAVVAWAETSYRVSQHRACQAVGVHRSLVRYWSVKASDAPLRQRLHAPAAARPTFGVKRLQVLLRREGLQGNHKKVERRYRAEGLQRRRRAPMSSGRWTSWTTRSAMAGRSESSPWSMSIPASTSPYARHPQGRSATRNPHRRHFPVRCAKLPCSPSQNPSPHSLQ